MNSFFSQVRRFLKSLRPARGNHRRRPLRLEQLEDRSVPTVSLLSQFDGLSHNQTGGIPPDTCGAAGPVNYVETVNQALRISNKTTGAAVAYDGFAYFWPRTGGLPRVAGSGAHFSDPIVVWDDQVQRFIVGDQDINTSTHVSLFDLAVSKTATPNSLSASDWYFLQVNTTETNYNADYPGNFGYNHDAFVFTLNMYQVSASGTFHVQVNSLKISDLVNGTLTAFQNDVAGYGVSLRPAVMHDSVAGDPMWLVNTTFGSYSSINVVKMTNVLSSSATFSNTALTVNPYTFLAFPKQPDGSQVVGDINSGILKVAESGGKLVATHAIGTSTTQDDARWYLVNVASGTPALLDQGDVVSPTTGAGTNNVYDYYPGIDINSSGAIGMSFMQSSPGQYVSVYVTGRTSGDPAGTMETPVLVQAGGGELPRRLEPAAGRRP
jgi:hypothetical protein